MARIAMHQPNTVYDASEGDKFKADSTLEVVTCSACHIVYAIPASLKRAALKYHGDRPDGWKLCCPLGHTWWYIGETEEERLRRQLGYARDATAHERARRDQAEAQARAQKAAKTRIKNDRDRIRNRVGAGVCPCCNRTFKQLARHMDAKHPDYREPAE